MVRRLQRGLRELLGERKSLEKRVFFLGKLGISLVGLGFGSWVSISCNF